MKWYYFTLVIGVLLDLAVLPWFFGASLIPNLFFTILPFGFLFLPSKHLKLLFIFSLIYIRVTTSFNMGIIFLALMLMLVFERWFLTNFFHRSAWQTLAFSGFGVLVFYATLFSLNWALGLGSIEEGISRIGIIIFLTLTSAIASFLFNKFLGRELANV
ncbi:MAG: hypothetical protein Q8Q90_03335 [bacterium]|nr:hypothetical protein [bacterium]